MSEKFKFWMVWNKASFAPTYQHQTKESAENEADRLSRAHKGQTFVVLESLSERVVNDVLVTNHIDPIPF